MEKLAVDENSENKDPKPETEPAAPAVVEEVKEAMEKLAVDENSENKDPKPETELAAAAKKKNKKKKKASATEEKPTVEDKEDCKDGVEQKEALATVDENKDSAETCCAHCKRAGPSKRCSKRHPKCLKKMFCNETCESLAHADPKKAAVKKEAAGKAAAAKKANKVKNWKNTDS